MQPVDFTDITRSEPSEGAAADSAVQIQETILEEQEPEQSTVEDSVRESIKTEEDLVSVEDIKSSRPPSSGKPALQVILT